MPKAKINYNFCLTNQLCSYNCNLQAKIAFVNGKFCCNDSFYKCVGYKSNSMKGLTTETRIKAGKNTKGKIKSKETKDKLSASRRAYLNANPSKVPYLLNHSSKESYPEKYFREIFEKENLGLIPEFRVGTYDIDFAKPELKFGIEIDGEQHYVDARIVEHDIKRYEYLSQHGWNIFRIRWAQYSSLSYDDKSKIIQDIKGILENGRS